LGAQGARAGPQTPAAAERIGFALAAAQRAQARGEWGAVRSWAALAVAAIESERFVMQNVVSHGNAAQLLDVLALYDPYAFGRDPDRDARVDSMMIVLEEIEAYNRRHAWWFAGAPSGVEYDPRTGLVRRFERCDIDYDTWTRQIVRFGVCTVDYDPWTRMPRRIGPIEIDYDPFREFPRRIAGIDIR
jgi:hypothetical protein